MSNDTVLTNEILSITEHFFGLPATQSVIFKYIEVQNLFLSSEDLQNRSVNIIFSKNLDIEAIEYYFRVHKKNHILSKKILCAFYLLETQNIYLPHFILGKKLGFFSAIIHLSFQVPRSVFLYVKGACLIWRYRLV